jgi:hypothetical protein
LAPILTGLSRSVVQFAIGEHTGVGGDP